MIEIKNLSVFGFQKLAYDALIFSKKDIKDDKFAEFLLLVHICRPSFLFMHCKDNIVRDKLEKKLTSFGMITISTLDYGRFITGLNVEMTNITDPDKSWTVWSNKQYNHIALGTTPHGSWEKRVARPSKLDDFSGLNWNKMPTRHGEVYSTESVPVLKHEWDEHEYYEKWTSPKTEQQVFK
ncbi:hypothetical protein RFI_02292 [Reticulomyxa filosa]|uniref:Uncharacterized protein n=1 Tax=Reticulomyxa filosa TaxID=46433 RepID=X6P8B8_RETFI|nr:hypothetical protein RFI_02292 [Reticulomyxa filosa]|eukprot:ETO34795.1 hypothetical protein RFI_02292 [Reticulomyxa filosa]